MSKLQSSFPNECKSQPEILRVFPLVWDSHLLDGERSSYKERQSDLKSGWGGDERAEMHRQREQKRDRI